MGAGAARLLGREGKRHGEKQGGGLPPAAPWAASRGQPEQRCAAQASAAAAGGACCCCNGCACGCACCPTGAIIGGAAGAAAPAAAPLLAAEAAAAVADAMMGTELLGAPVPAWGAGVTLGEGSVPGNCGGGWQKSRGVSGPATDNKKPPPVAAHTGPCFSRCPHSCASGAWAAQRPASSSRLAPALCAQPLAVRRHGRPPHAPHLLHLARQRAVAVEQDGPAALVLVQQAGVLEVLHQRRLALWAAAEGGRGGRRAGVVGADGEGCGQHAATGARRAGAEPPSRACGPASSQAHLDAAVRDVADLLAVELGPLLAVQLLHKGDDVLGPHLRKSLHSLNSKEAVAAMHPAAASAHMQASSGG